MTRQILLASAAALMAAACVNAVTPTTRAGQQSEAPMAAAPKFDAKTQSYVDRMLAYSYQMRVGQYEVANDAVTMMEAATAAEPGNAELWAQLGGAYGLQAMLYTLPGKNPMDAFTTLGKSIAAQKKALDIDPDNLVALGGHGSNAMVFSLIQQKPELGQKGIAEMNRAVDLAPKNRAQVQRLLRVQTLINMPEPYRNRVIETEDIDYLIRISEGTRQGDYMRVLKADIAIEMGKPEVARVEYATAAKSSRAGGEIARQRLTALDKGGVPATDIAQLRKDIGQCTACHGVPPSRS